MTTGDAAGEPGSLTVSGTVGCRVTEAKYPCSNRTKDKSYNNGQRSYKNRKRVYCEYCNPL